MIDADVVKDISEKVSDLIDDAKNAELYSVATTLRRALYDLEGILEEDDE